MKRTALTPSTTPMRPSWAKRVEKMNRFFGGVPWRVWSGDTDESAYKNVHK